MMTATRNKRPLQAAALSALVLLLLVRVTASTQADAQQQINCDRRPHLVNVDPKGGRYYATCTTSASTRSHVIGPLYVCYGYQWMASVSESYSLGGNLEWEFGLTSHWSGSTCTNTITGFENPGEIYPLYEGWGWYVDVLQNTESLSAPWEVNYYLAGQLHFLYVANAGTISCSITGYLAAQPAVWCN